MRIGVTLKDLREEVQVHAGLSRNAAHNIQRRDEINALINQVEREMAIDDDWPSNHHEQEVMVAAGNIIDGLPSQIDFSQISEVWCQYGSQWLPVGYGIGREERSLYDTTQRSIPIQKWKIRTPGNLTFEVWPVPSQDQTLRFTGSKKLGGMVNDQDVCTLDGDVIVLRAAAEILLADGKDTLAQVKMGKAAKLTNKLLKRLGSKKREPVSLIPQNRKALRPYIDFIPPE